MYEKKEQLKNVLSLSFLLSLSLSLWISALSFLEKRVEDRF